MRYFSTGRGWDSPAGLRRRLDCRHYIPEPGQHRYWPSRGKPNHQYDRSQGHDRTTHDTLVRVDQPRRNSFGAFQSGECEPPHIDRRLSATWPPSPMPWWARHHPSDFVNRRAAAQTQGAPILYQTTHEANDNTITPAQYQPRIVCSLIGISCEAW